eukprot:CAMPEP_0201110480 /NCGR_PEP_ID=MMETSP0812-20130820/70555_1 /ASSEMBLY_ACC=CAM_ASM_000668 /TAXON_ID=98059 /ORGANISM="Dinobryon sp., Strain UTEXLB2267" /LENGTH=246 /DNA_ID=CAMNT_0047372931 /DNA_START=45 /DNA_END=786 /DNA_ORIENTATION=-
MTVYYGGLIAPRSTWERRQLGSQFLHTRVGDEQRVLELRGRQSVLGDGGPLVGPGEHLVGAQADHGLDGEGVACGHDPGAVVVPVVQHIGVRVEQPAHPVAAEDLHGAVALGRYDVLDDAAQLAVLHPWPAVGDGGLPGSEGGLHQVPHGLRHGLLGPHEDRLGAVAVHAVVEDRHVDVEDVPGQQLRVVGDAVADHLIDRCAAGLREAVVVQRGGVRVPGDGLLVHQLVDEVGSDAGLHCPHRSV